MVHKNLLLLESLGLNNLEAEVYFFLLTAEPQTAYRIGKELGKPTANVYKAVEALSRKGAVLVEEGDNRLCRSVPIKEFLSHVKRDFLSRTVEAEKSLADFKVDVRDEAVYQLQSPSLVLERCRTMLERCRKIAVVDIFPEPLEQVRTAIERAIQRKVEVYVQVYSPVNIPGAKVVLATEGENALKHWRSQQINVVIDGQEHLLALMNQGLSTVYQAIWSQSLYLSCILHAGLMQEYTIHRLRSEVEKPHALKNMRLILSDAKFFMNTQVPGQRTLYYRYVSPDQSAEPYHKGKAGS